MDTNLPGLFQSPRGRGTLKYSRGAVRLGLRRNLTSPGLSRQQSGEHDGIFPSSLCPPPHSERQTRSPNVSTTPQERKNTPQKRKKKQFRCFADASSCQWLSVSYLSQSPSFSFSLCLALAQDRACRWHCFQLGRQLASVPLTKGYSHRLLGSESNHTSLTNHRASSSWCNHSHTDTDAHTHSHTNRHTYTDAQSYARTALTFLPPPST